MKVVAYVPDLMDRSKFGRGPEGTELVFVHDPAGLAQPDADLVVADLGRPGVLQALAGVEATRIGFGSHVDDDVRQRAVDLGVRFYARSAFFSRLVTILTNSDAQSAD